MLFLTQTLPPSPVDHLWLQNADRKIENIDELQLFVGYARARWRTHGPTSTSTFQDRPQNRAFLCRAECGLRRLMQPSHAGATSRNIRSSWFFHSDLADKLVFVLYLIGSYFGAFDTQWTLVSNLNPPLKHLSILDFVLTKMAEIFCGVKMDAMAAENNFSRRLEITNYQHQYLLGDHQAYPQVIEQSKKTWCIGYFMPKSVKSIFPFLLPI